MDAEDNPSNPAAPVDRDCPIPATHRRLADVHELWHEAARDYFDPERFRRRLNQLIQEARNVTFVLQGEKRAIPGFDEWYGKREKGTDVPGIWQRRLMGDPVMRWLGDARTQVTKRGDLETCSKARATVLRSWTERAVAEIDVPPMTPMDEIVELFTGRLPQELLERGILVVERRWIAETLPSHEVLDALAHAYGVLSTLVAEAHERCGAEYTTARMTPVGPLPFPTGHLAGRLPCMTMLDEWRRVCVHLRTGDTLAPAQMPAVPDYLQAKERYGDLLGQVSPSGPVEGPDTFLTNFGRWLFDTSRLFLERDGYHCMALWMIGPGTECYLHQIDHYDRDELLLLIENLAEQAEQLGVWGVASVHESWIAPFDPAFPERPASESPDRSEVLCVDLAVADGRVRHYMVPFRKTDRGIEFDEEMVGDQQPIAFDLEPFRRRWRRQQNPET